MGLPRITDQFTSYNPECRTCGGEGIVCENHPDRPWEGTVPGGCDCGAGAPCPRCTRQARMD